jgi:hypothetical protein
MNPSALKQRLIEDFERLSPEQQQRVQEFAHALAGSRPRSVPARSLLKYAGMLDPESAREMRQAIEEAFERVEPDEW